MIDASPADDVGRDARLTDAAVLALAGAQRAMPRDGDYVVCRAESASAGITLHARALVVVRSLRVAAQLTRLETPADIDHALPSELQFASVEHDDVFLDVARPTTARATSNFGAQTAQQQQHIES